MKIKVKYIEFIISKYFFKKFFTYIIDRFSYTLIKTKHYFILKNPNNINQKNKKY